MTIESPVVGVVPAVGEGEVEVLGWRGGGVGAGALVRTRAVTGVGDVVWREGVDAATAAGEAGVFGWSEDPFGA